MKQSQAIIIVLVIIALVQMACSMPQPQSAVETPAFVTPTSGPAVITATERGREILVAGRARRVAALDALLVDVAPEDRAALGTAVSIIEERLLGDG
jgi:hypothetical protein